MVEVKGKVQPQIRCSARGKGEKTFRVLSWIAELDDRWEIQK
jgi:hypothetical protein